ncbi:MAG: hypothetical protein K0R44_3790 [Thermomicrobiales bacterium]|nr:hypothetical protein [Thermomicrobiales bacterium]
MECVCRRSDLYVLTSDADRPGIGLIHAGEHVHERGLAGAVLTENGVDLARPQIEGDAVVGDDRPKALADAAHLDDGRRGVGVMGNG